MTRRGDADAAAGEAAPPAAPVGPPAHAPRLDALALVKEVALDRLERLLERLLAALRRYRARRGRWWDRG